jgi:hypothetical protein
LPRGISLLRTLPARAEANVVTFRRYIVVCVSFIAICALAQPSSAADPNKAFDGGGVLGLTLRTQLEKGLKARRPVEFDYIDQIIKLVDEEKLPRSLVVSTYLWAQRKPSRQLQYFQFALQMRAKGLDVELPDLRKQAVGIASNGGQHGVNVGMMSQSVPQNGVITGK